MNRARRVELLVVLAAIVELAAGDARAQDTSGGDAPAPQADPVQEAKQQYATGADAYAAKRFVEAALHFEAAAAHRPHAAALYNAGLAWEQSGHPERAADDFGRAVDVPGLSPAQIQNARGRLVTLEKTMGTLDVTAPEGWRVQLDANTDAPTPAHLHAAPGAHVLSILAPEAPIKHKDVTLELGKATPIELTVEPIAPPPRPVVAEPKPESEAQPPPPPPSWWNLRRGLGVGAIGVGGAFVVSGIVFGLSALDARDAYNAAPSRAGYDHAGALATWTDVTLIAGCVFAAGGAALVLWPDKKSDTSSDAGAHATRTKPNFNLAVMPTLGGAMMRGSF